MKDDKITPSGEPKLSIREAGFAKWFDNFWYHYKIQAIIALVLLFTVVISTVQLATRERFDYHLLYAGPRIIAVQDIAYMRRAVETVGEDIDKNGKVAVSIDDIVMLSPEERAAAMEAGSVFNAEFINQSMNEYYQQIVAGEAVVCLLSPYMYDMVHESDGFMPLAEIFDEIPASAYDDCGILLAKTEFGQSFNGMDDLPEDTILCIRRLSSLSKMKGQNKTEKLHEGYVALFKSIENYTAPVE